MAKGFLGTNPTNQTFDVAEHNGRYYDARSGRELKRGNTNWNGMNNYSYVDQGSGGGVTLNEIMAAQENAARLEREKLTRMKEQGLNPDGSPIRPEYENIRGQDGQLLDQYRLQAQPDIQVDQRAMSSIRDQAFQQGPSQWATQALDKQKLEELDALDKTRAQSAGSQAQTMNALMMNGGLSSGARERMGSRASRDQVLAAQGTYRQGALDRSNIGLQDQTRKDDFMKQTVANDFNMANVGIQNRQYSTQVQQQNLNNTLREIEGKRAFDMGTYSEQLKKYGAEKQSEAMMKSSGGGKK